MKQLTLPSNTDASFIAYGSFKPGELRYGLIEPFVASAKPLRIYGIMKEKDGVPLFYSKEIFPWADFDYKAVEICFHKGQEQIAYKIICENEPNTYYTWRNLNGCNTLEGKKTLRGLNEFLDTSWSFKDDPYFDQGLLSCKEISVGSHTSEEKLNLTYHHFFCNQSAYMLLWSIIERFCTIKYGNITPSEKLKRLATDNQIDWKFVVNIVNRNDEIIRSDKDKEKLKLDPNASIKKILDYYYGLRSNMVHRGKDVFGDINRIENAFSELHQITTYIIKSHY